VHGDPVDEAGLRVRVQGVLDTFLARQGETLAEIGPELGDLVEAASTLLHGGKRLRAAFCYWGWRGAGRGDDDRVVSAAAAVEMLHAAALIHDDVIDNSDTRRGHPAAHRRFADQHRAAGWHGDADRFGVAAAVLLGDLCLAWSDSLLTGCGLPSVASAPVRGVFDQMRTEVMAGQYLDVLAQATGAATDPATAVDQARRVIRHKSASYSVEQPLLLGGTLAEAPAPVLDVYRDFGLALGEAFQLRDDVLGVYGDPAQTGKPAGDDLREGKRTVLVATAQLRATPAQRDVLRTQLGRADLDQAGLDALRAVIVDTGALAEVEQRITMLSRRALLTADSGVLDPPARDVLVALVSAATDRAH
jgi:geranylgeranyl diphosphate synthase type I